MDMKAYQRIIISRTDSIGDVILTLPLSGILKKQFPQSEIIFLGRSYTQDVIGACEHINTFLNWDELASKEETSAIRDLKDLAADLIIHVFPRQEIAHLAKRAGIPTRLGTTNRLYHWFNCNKLVRLSRRKSSLHEAQLNINLVKSITGIDDMPLGNIHKFYGLTQTQVLDTNFTTLFDKEKINVILHPKSKGSAREWGLNNFIELIKILPDEKYKVFISGTEDEGLMMKDSGIFDIDHVVNLCGKMSLAQLISFIKACDVLVAASTGPLHLAAALGIKAIGIYPPIRPMHPERWAPIGEKATFLVKDKECDECRKQGPCHCMQEILPDKILKQIGA